MEWTAYSWDETFNWRARVIASQLQESRVPLRGENQTPGERCFKIKLFASSKEAPITRATRGENSHFLIEYFCSGEKGRKTSLEKWQKCSSNILMRFRSIYSENKNKKNLRTRDEQQRAAHSPSGWFWRQEWSESKVFAKSSRLFRGRKVLMTSGSAIVRARDSLR